MGEPRNEIQSFSDKLAECEFQLTGPAEREEIVGWIKIQAATFLCGREDNKKRGLIESGSLAQNGFCIKKTLIKTKFKHFIN